MGTHPLPTVKPSKVQGPASRGATHLPQHLRAAVIMQGWGRQWPCPASCGSSSPGPSRSPSTGHRRAMEGAPPWRWASPADPLRTVSIERQESRRAEGGKPPGQLSSRRSRQVDGEGQTALRFPCRRRERPRPAGRQSSSYDHARAQRSCL